MGNVKGRPSHATVVAYLALFVALGGTSYAAVQLSKNSVLSKHIKNGQVERADISRSAVDTTRIKDASLLRADFAPGQLPEGPAGPKGDPGAVGAKGETGAAGSKGDPGAPGATKLIVRPGTVVFLAAGAPGHAQASCAAGEKAVSGGAFTDHANTTMSSSNALTVSPSDPTPIGWRVAYDNNATEQSKVAPFVNCVSP